MVRVRQGRPGVSTLPSLDPPDWVAPRAGSDLSLLFDETLRHSDTQTHAARALALIAAEKPSFPASSLLFPRFSFFSTFLLQRLTQLYLNIV
jgi:hypothetical protein